MHAIEPYYNWSHLYSSELDQLSPFFKVEYDLFHFTHSVYDHVIHPQWDYFGSETLYLKILFADYETGFCVIEFIGEWNDTISNDVMHLKRNVLDQLSLHGINKYLLVGEHIFNFHYSDLEYYEEWIDDLEDGWIATIGLQHHVLSDWEQFGLNQYVFMGEFINDIPWRTIQPKKLFEGLDDKFSRFLS